MNTAIELNRLPKPTVIEELDKKLQIIRYRKQELEESFKGLIHEAERIYKNWEH